MATTAPGSPYVESSDLVANYPAVSEALAERVDTVGVLPFADSTARGTAIPSPTEGQYTYLQDTNATEYWDGSAWVAAGVAPGLVHINTTTFTTSAAVNVNNVFTSTYDNYRIVFQLTASADANIQLRFRVGGVDASGAEYRNQSALLATGSWTQLQSTGNATEFFIGSTRVAGDPEAHGDMTVGQPHEAVDSILYGMTYGARTGIVTATPIITGGRLDNGTSYDGFTLYPHTGTVTGIVRVYGYKD